MGGGCPTSTTNKVRRVGGIGKKRGKAKRGGGGREMKE